MTNTVVIQERTDEKGLIHRIEIPLMTYLTEHDLEPVVRCKDCKYYLQSNEKCELVDTRLRFYETDKTWTGDCFCSWGERREDAKTN